MCALTTWSQVARSEVRLAPATDGQLGAWLVTGPIGMRPALGSQPRWGNQWRAVSIADGALDLDRELGTQGKAGAYALLGGVIELPTALDGYVLLSADGGVTLSIDDATLLDRDVPRQRAESWDAVPVALGAGEHRVMLRLHHRGGRWAAEVRIVQARTWLPPPGLSLRLPGTTDRDAANLASRMQTVSVDPNPDAGGFQPRLSVEYRRGAPRDMALPVTAQIPGAWSAALGDVPVGESGVHPLVALLPRVSPDQARHTRLLVRTAAHERKLDLTLPARAPALLGRAAAQLDQIRERSDLLRCDVVRSTIEWHLARITSPRSLDDLERILTLLERGVDPLTRPGIIDLAIRSDLDQRPQALRLHVPRGYPGPAGHRYPLVVLLHGYDGSPSGIMNAFLDDDAITPHPKVDGFLIAPAAHGNSFYRGPGEHAVLAALDFAVGTYPIDPDRVSITGVSMGGTGAAQIGLAHADRFAAAAPLCGYHSYFVRRDTQHRPLRPWEQSLMHHGSPASWAANGRHLPLYVAQGTQDLPLSNSRVLVDAYRRLGHSVVDDWPATGHAVWEQAYAGARLWAWLTRHRRDPDPRRITLRTDALRYAQRQWLRLVQITDRGRMAQVDAEVLGPERVRVTTDGVTEFEIDRPGVTEIVVDGTEIRFEPGERVAARSDGQAWTRAGPAATSGKRPGLEGPVSDVWLGPVVLVHGSEDPAWARAGREVARRLARLRYSVDIAYPIVADVDLTAELSQGRSLILVGSPATNRVLARIDARLPIRVDAGCILVGSERHCGSEVGAVFIYPNPEQPDRYVVVVESPTLPGLLRALSLPQLIPDFLVFDSAVAASAGEQVLGSGHVLAGGFFRSDWSLPPSVRDPHAKLQSAGDARGEAPRTRD